MTRIAENHGTVGPLLLRHRVGRRHVVRPQQIGRHMCDTKKSVSSLRLFRSGLVKLR